MAARDATPTARTTLAADVHERLRAAIISGEYRPRERLIELDIAQRFETSRTPLRESMLRLEGEGLVVRHRQGWAVREYAPAEIRDLYEIRAGLEALAAGLAATRATDDQVRALVDVHGDDSALARSPRERLLTVNDAFHAALLAASGNALLPEAVRLSREHFFNYRVLELFSDAQAARSLDEHGRIVEAVRDRRPDDAGREAREHVLGALEVVLHRLR